MNVPLYMVYDYKLHTNGVIFIKVCRILSLFNILWCLDVNWTMHSNITIVWGAMQNIISTLIHSNTECTTQLPERSLTNNTF